LKERFPGPENLRDCSAIVPQTVAVAEYTFNEAQLIHDEATTSFSPAATLANRGTEVANAA